MSQIEVFKGSDGWRFRVKASNGRILAQSAVYDSKPNAVRGASDLTKAVLEGQADMIRG